MNKKTQYQFTYLDWLHFCHYSPLAKAIFKRYRKKLVKLKGIDFMSCQGEMWRKLGNAYREFKEQHKKHRRVSRSSKLKAIAQKQSTRANADLKIRRGYRIGSKAYLKRTKELGKQRF